MNRDHTDIDQFEDLVIHPYLEPPFLQLRRLCTSSKGMFFLDKWYDFFLWCLLSFLCFEVTTNGVQPHSDEWRTVPLVPLGFSTTIVPLSYPGASSSKGKVCSPWCFIIASHFCSRMLQVGTNGKSIDPLFLTLGIKRVKNPTCTTIHQWLDLKRSHFHRLVLGRFHCLPWPELPDKAQVVTGGGATLFHSTICHMPYCHITTLPCCHTDTSLASWCQWWISVLHCASISNRCTRMYHQVVVGGYTGPQYQVVTLHKILQRSQEVIAHFKTPTRWTFCVDPVQQFE